MYVCETSSHTERMEPSMTPNNWHSLTEVRLGNEGLRACIMATWTTCHIAASAIDFITVTGDWLMM